ncbi:bacteriorhodopsin [Halobacillus litoralis]|uniref:bacteriorhodopsin n=1 Tax=Halobacillus litoralis TaxID=45668 RepID=UPI001CFD51FE|nr:bacteriorhodopsin [Halobacillus litoralis]
MENFSTLHYLYSLIMLAGALYFYYLSRRPKGVPTYEYFLAITIPLWSGAAYLAIAFGQGVLKQSERTVYFARYLDWVVTTPLLLLALGLTAMIYVDKKNKTLLVTLVSLDVFMILTGLIADFSTGFIKYIWYTLGVIALLLILYIVWFPLRRIADTFGHKLSVHYRRCAAYLTCFWVLYPTAWLLGPSGVGLTQDMVDVAAFIILPIFSKVGFSILDLHGLRRLYK